MTNVKMKTSLVCGNFLISYFSLDILDLSRNHISCVPFFKIQK
jgi:hypothetical protein